MIRPRKKRRHWFRRFMFFCVLAIIIVAGVHFRFQIVDFAQSVWLVARKPEIASVLRAIHRENFGMLCVKNSTGADDCYVFDGDGIVFDSARMLVGDVIVRVDDQSDFKPILGEPFINADIWKNMAPIVAYAKDDMPRSRITLDRVAEELTITFFESGTRLYFNLRLDPAEHIRALKELQKTVVLTSLEYADLRVKGRVFYK